jgi:YD repeat-containing protein
MARKHTHSASRRVFVLQAIAALAASPAFGETVTYTYDELGRVKTVTYNNGQVITYNYDAAGNRTTLNQAQPTALNGSLSASPVAISSGGSSTLTWSSNNATSASIDNGIGAVTPASGGTVLVSPTTTTTYTLTLNGSGGPITRQVTVTVS